jgi:hypothetical protein
MNDAQFRAYYQELASALDDCCLPPMDEAEARTFFDRKQSVSDVMLHMNALELDAYLGLEPERLN